MHHVETTPEPRCTQAPSLQKLLSIVISSVKVSLFQQSAVRAPRTARERSRFHCWDLVQRKWQTVMVPPEAYGAREHVSMIPRRGRRSRLWSCAIRPKSMSKVRAAVQQRHGHVKHISARCVISTRTGCGSSVYQSCTKSTVS